MKKDNSTKPSNVRKQMLENRFEHTLENCFKAKEELIKSGLLKEEDFYLADFEFTEIGYLIGEPMIDTKDDYCLSALESYKQKCFSEENDDDMADFYIENGLV